MALAGALLAAAPRVTPVAGHPLAFWADASGMERRGGDAAVARALLAAAREAGFAAARVGIARTCIAAAMATRERGSAWRVVPSGRDASFVARRPLELLPMEVEMREALRLLGLRSCGELAQFVAADVELRWGAAGMAVWQLAHGEDRRWPFRPPLPGRVVAEAEWEPPVETTEALRFVIRGLLASVVERIAERQRVPARLRLTFRLDGAPEETRELRPARPTADTRVLASLCDAVLEGFTAGGGLPAPVSGVWMEAIEDGASLADQLDAFRPAAPDPAAVHGALLPLLARWGEESLVRATVHGAHLPEAHAAWAAAGARAIPELARQRASRDGTPTERFTPESELELCLRRFPEPRAVRVRTDDRGRPIRIGGTPALPGDGDGNGTAERESPDGRECRVRAEGPERLSGLWRTDGYAREYWLAEREDGCLMLLFRDAATTQWCVEGWYD